MEHFMRELITGQVEGAYPKGSRVVKVQSDPGDTHDVGDEATVIGSVRVPGEIEIGYFVSWDDIPKVVMFVVGSKIRPLNLH